MITYVFNDNEIITYQDFSNGTARFELMYELIDFLSSQTTHYYYKCPHNLNVQ